MTQVELLPCPFCGTAPLHTHAYGEQAAEHIHNDCVLRNRVVPVSKWNTRTPSPATGSAVPASTVAPSPVGEVEDALTADFHGLRQRIDLRFTSGNDVSVERASITIDEWMRLRSLATKGDKAALAAQAPKPASAGGEVDDILHRVVDRFDELPEWLRNIARAYIEQGFNIAAEADTAPDEEDDGLDMTLGLRTNPPAADRLAQTVTDAEVEAACIAANGFAWWDSGAGVGEKEAVRVAIRKILEAFLRARESAPAQEPVAWLTSNRRQVITDAKKKEWVASGEEPFVSDAKQFPVPCYAAAPRAGS